jgi:hypothetical protein
VKRGEKMVLVVRIMTTTALAEEAVLKMEMADVAPGQWTMGLLVAMAWLPVASAGA